MRVQGQCQGFCTPGTSGNRIADTRKKLTRERRRSPSNLRSPSPKRSLRRPPSFSPECSRAGSVTGKSGPSTLPLADRSRDVYMGDEDVGSSGEASARFSIEGQATKILEKAKGDKGKGRADSRE